MGRPSIDISGQKFGDWTVLYKGQSDARSAVRWVCLCACGTTRQVYAARLRCGKSTSCGCHGPSNRLTLTGKTFGRLTVIGPVHSRKQKTQWKCRCDCGVVCTKEGAKLMAAAVRSCGCLLPDVAMQRRGSSHHNWSGGRVVSAGGYVYVLTRSGRYEFEHRLVMEQSLGRSLLSSETVHHVNGKRNDNRIENLELRSGRHGKGQCVGDLVAWAKELLEQYEPSALTPKGCPAVELRVGSLSDMWTAVTP